MEFAFVYGTLLFPQVRRVLLPHLTQEGRPATLKGFRCYECKTRPTCNFPAIVPEEGSSVDGLLFGVDNSDLEILDHFEDVAHDFYTRVSVTVHVGTNESVTSWVYICSNGLRDVLLEPLSKTWHPLLFERDLDEYVRRIS